MNNTPNIYVSDGLFGLPANFTDFRPPSSFAQQLAQVINRPAELQSLLLSAREEIADAKERAVAVVRDSPEIIYGEASARYRLNRALAAELGIPLSQVKLLSPLPAYSADLPHGHVRVETNRSYAPPATATVTATVTATATATATATVAPARVN